MRPGELIEWTRGASPGDWGVYHSGRWRGQPPEVLHTAHQLHREGRLFLFQRNGCYCAMKLSSRARRFIAKVSASVPSPRMGPFGHYANGTGGDPGPWI